MDTLNLDERQLAVIMIEMDIRAGILHPSDFSLEPVFDKYRKLAKQCLLQKDSWSDTLKDFVKDW